VSDLQECTTLNRQIFETATLILQDQYDLSSTTLILAGDFYGESYFDQNIQKRIEIRGKTGLVDYENLTINKLPRFIVYGNHDLPNPKLDLCKHLKLSNGTQINGVDFIESKDFSNFFKEIKTALKLKPDVFVSHETPLLQNNSKGNINLTKLVKTYKPKIHIFGHCHFRSPIFFRM